nr:MAG TPA: hypothetical protein [Herelleviridae sp.]DAZ67013.1 MAG TPA: hypothetical protein [Caudoviricetes sp.]
MVRGGNKEFGWFYDSKFFARNIGYDIRRH